MTQTAVHIPTLETERLTLRAPTPQDIATYLRFYTASNVEIGGYTRTGDEAEIAAKLDRNIADWDAKGFGIFLVVPKSGETPVGGVGLSHPDGWPSHELTWWLLADAQGRGYATEASRAVINWAYETLGWPRVETHMRDGNAPAHAIARRLGGVVDRRETFPDGVTRDVYLLPRQSVAS